MRKDAVKILHAAIDAVKPAQLILNTIALSGNMLFVGEQSFDINALDKIYMVAAGKAAAAMAAEFENILGDRLNEGLVVTKYDHGLPSPKITCIEAGHPIPDEQSILASRLIMDIAKKAGENDLFIFLLSGGASALIGDLPEGIALEDLMTLSRLLLHTGADIHELNIVRKHLSVLKGGQLSRFVWPATLVCLAISDVSGDIPDSIGSGPAVPDRSTFDDAWQVIMKYNLENKVPDTIRKHLRNGRDGLICETPKPDDAVFSKSHFKLIGNNEKALKAAARTAAELGYHTIIVEKQFTGDTASEALVLFEFAKNYTGRRPACIIAGGETTVSVKGSGKGGRNQQMALTVLNEWINNTDEFPHLLFLASATDGTDGPTDAAGAMVDEKFVQEILAKKIDVMAYLKNNDSYHFFSGTDMHIITGPTQTNVMDIVILIIT